MAKRKKSFILVLLGIVLVSVFLLFATNSYLVIRQMLGNDVMIRLSADKENLFLEHNQIDNVTFSIFATTNLFCKIECSSEFFDISNNLSIEEYSFNITPANLESRSYQFNASKPGVGQSLYRFGVKCKSAKTTLCRTSEEPIKRTLLITLNYNITPEEQKFRDESMEKISDMLERAFYLDYESNALLLTVKNNGGIDFGGLNIESVKPEILDSIRAGNYMKMLWENYDDGLLQKEIESNKNINDTEYKLNGINRTIYSKVLSYNMLGENLSSIRRTLFGFSKINVTNSTSIKINNAIKNFNDALNLFAKKSGISEKQLIVDGIANETLTISREIENETNSNLSLCCLASENLNDANLSATFITNYKPSAIEFKERPPKCCLYEKCRDCCGECNDNYPIILLHGHDFSKEVSSEHSLNAFQEIQDLLDKDGYLNAGSIILSTQDNTQNNIWGLMNTPVSVEASYYFDIYKTTGKGRVIETKADNLDTYALRLKDIIELMKYKTGKDKVIIISHSMGGLVSRKYVQIFGNSSIDKLIMIGTPNNGIDDAILRYCPVFGAELECRDMDKNSLFINKLNSEEQNVPTYNIIGTGCDMANETGDGIVKKSSAYMENAINYYVEGKCDGFAYLHENLLKMDKYSEVYGIIKGILQ
jgi:hypothetical protein